MVPLSAVLSNYSLSFSYFFIRYRRTDLFFHIFWFYSFFIMTFYHRFRAASVRACFCTHQSRFRRASVIKFACVFKFIISFLIMKLIASFSKYGLKVNWFIHKYGNFQSLPLWCRPAFCSAFVDNLWSTAWLISRDLISQSFVSNLNNASKFSFLFYLWVSLEIAIWISSGN